MTLVQTSAEMTRICLGLTMATQLPPGDEVREAHVRAALNRIESVVLAYDCDELAATASVVAS